MKRDAVLKIINPAGKENAMLTYTEMKEGLIQEGIQKGRQEGVREGRQEGIEEGESKALHNLAQNMRTEGLSIETIMRVTGLSEQEVQGLN